MNITDQFSPISIITLCLAIFALVWAQRKVVESIFPNLKKNKSKWSRLWFEFFVPLGPLGTGALIGLLADSYPWPDVFANSSIGRVLFGITCGLLSGFAYRLVKKNLVDKLKE